MCSICKDVLIQFELEHTEARCPLAASLYCSSCACFGHLTRNCRAKPSKRYTQPVYVEQLIGVNDLLEFGIRTKTPLPVQKEEEPIPQLLEIKDTDSAITTFLTSKGIKAGKKSMLRIQLENYAKTEKLRVIYQK